tara:strand:- start:2 stop:229 length:228 start_codon:yes stop_codon:yes gene_type:complete
MANLKIEIASEEALYITINNKVIYIDDSTDELIIDTWDEEPSVSFELDDEFKELLESHEGKSHLTLVSEKEDEDG